MQIVSNEISFLPFILFLNQGLHILLLVFYDTRCSSLCDCDCEERTGSKLRESTAFLHTGHVWSIQLWTLIKAEKKYF